MFVHKELFINLEQDQYLKKPYRHADAVLLNSADFEKQTLINHADFILNQLKNTDVSQSKLINKTHQFFTVLEHQFLIKPVSKHTLQHFYFMHFTHELVMRSAPYPKLLSHSFKCLLNNIVSILNILTCQQSTIDFRHSIWRTLSRNCSDFDSAFTDYFINSKKQYKQLWYYINIEIESYKHHPDTVYDGISDHLLHVVKLERSFFQNRATPKTREWIVESMSQSKFYEEYNLSFLKKIIAKKLIYLCLSTRELTKTNTPEIFAWDLSFIKSLQRQCTNVIQTHLIIEQTKHYFQQYNVTNSSINWSEIQNKHVTKDQLISLITEKSKLTPIDAHQYLEYIKNTVPNNLNENHDILSNISDLLLKYTTGPICPPANDIMFPITDLFILINHLAFTYKPSLKHYYQKITNDYLINLIFNDDLKIPSTSNFLLLSNRIIAARCWINQICEALAAMRISRQHMIQKGLLLSEQKSVLPIIHSIPNRLAPLFNSFFSIEPSTTPTTKEHFQKELSIVIQQFINDIFNQYKYDFLTLIEDGLIQGLPLKKTQKNRLLHPFWNELIDAQKIIKQLDPCKKDSAINHLKSTNFLPTTHVEFIKINRIIYNLTPPSFSLKLESYQMQEPIQLCKKECLSFIQQSMSGHFNYQIKNPIDEHCLIRIKTYFKLIKQKLNQSNA